MLNREKAMELLHSNVHENNLIKHSLSTEAVMRRLAERMGHDPEIWGLTGLMHDLDYTLTENKPERHGLESASMLQGELPPEAIRAIEAHAAEMNSSQPPSTDLEYALRCAETLTGLIMAAALVRPDRLSGMKSKSLKKKMKDKAFAASVNREIIGEYKYLGLEQTEFLTLGIEAMQGVAEDIGLDHS